MKYIAFYDSDEYLFENRSVQPSAANVVFYISKKIAENEKVDIISPSRTLNTKGYYAGRKIAVADKISVRQPPTFGVKSKVGRLFSLIFTQNWLTFYLLKNVRKGETIVAYYSLFTIVPLTILKKVKKIKLLLEIREIYSDVMIDKQKIREREFSFFEKADYYIFPTCQLNEIINQSKKPYFLNSGIYSIEKQVACENTDDYTHVVYAGTLSIEKGGAFNAVQIAEYMPDNYWIHILGFGTEREIIQIKNHIEKTKKKSKCKITYEGVLYGDDFSAFLQKCDIGLSTQNMNAGFNNTSFPSKILTYISNGLLVLSSSIDVVKTSDIGEYVYYYEEENAKSIANALLRIPVKEKKSSATDILKKLDLKFGESLKIILKN